MGKSQSLYGNIDIKRSIDSRKLVGADSKFYALKKVVFVFLLICSFILILYSSIALMLNPRIMDEPLLLYFIFPICAFLIAILIYRKLREKTLDVFSIKRDIESIREAILELMKKEKYSIDFKRENIIVAQKKSFSGYKAAIILLDESNIYYAMLNSDSTQNITPSVLSYRELKSYLKEIAIKS